MSASPALRLFDVTHCPHGAIFSGEQGNVLYLNCRHCISWP